MRNAILAAIASLGLFAAGAGVLAQESAEEIRHAAELKACAQLPEAERKPCEEKVRAIIRAERAARIELETRRWRSSN